ncbi:TPA: hypothetical protein N0F65_008965 [Lagenidium giganteum]|uniref:Serine/threonine-protein phosphatase n=1 Tax=Lagenidium giganteum TaxID=4803 RepID=A0AAV2YVV9_9STRA|nr:TPA: hypothetical protein N0F65_008965 [Lagenidium giganteum]
MGRHATKAKVALATARGVFEQQQTLAVSEALAIIHEAQDLLDHEANLVSVHGSVINVFGDIHGQFFDLMTLLDRVNIEQLEANDVKLLFLGDYVDRGAFSCEVVLFLLLLKIKYPQKVFLLRGNHECETISSFYGFRNECRAKYSISVYYHFLSCFQSMPISALIKTPRGNIFCVHGGLSPDLVSIHDIESIDRRREPPTEGPLCDLLWADPSVDVEGSSAAQAPAWSINRVRGCSYYFNSYAMFDFLNKNHLLSIIRAHEFEEDGYMLHFQSKANELLDKRDDKSMPPMITVFSAPNYCDTHFNVAAYLVITSEPFAWELKQVEASPHPAPILFGTERGSDIWRQFRTTLPFLPASKDFFEDIAVLAGKAKAERDEMPAFLRRDSPSLVHVEDLDPAELKRRQTSEMHPQAIRKVLDEEAHKWIQSDEGSFQVFPPEKNDSRSRSVSLSAQPGVEERLHLFTPQELEMMKLMFSLMDTDGSLTLSKPKVAQFIFNVLGERISDVDSARYLDALDHDRNGVVDFADILSWAAEMKKNYEKSERSIFKLGWIWRTVLHIDPYHAVMWAALAYLLRDMYFIHHHAFLRSRWLKAFGSFGTLLYAFELLGVRQVLFPWMPSAVHDQWSNLKRRLHFK